MAAPKTVLTYPLNGSLKDFDVPFEYLARKFVVVTLVGATRRVLVLNSEYRFTSKKQITTNTAWGPAQGFENIEVRRITSATERLVDFSDGSILRAYDLNTAQIQSLHIAEEARDLTADTIAVNNEGNLDARGKRLVNLADGIDPGDAVTVRQQLANSESAMASAVRAKTSEDNAKASENLSKAAANTSSTKAVESAESAELSRLAKVAAEAARDTTLTYRDTASSKATEAADSASTSTTAKDQSVTAKTAAEAARDAAANSATTAASAGVQLGMLMFGMRANPFIGFALDDGQELSRATYPDFAAALDAGLLPTTTEANWQSSPAWRGCFVANSSTGKFRMRDLNGASSGSWGGAFLRGVAGPGGATLRDQIQNITGSIGPDSQVSFQGPVGSGAFARLAAPTSTFRSAAEAGTGVYWNFDASRVARTGTETFPTHTNGAWMTRLFGSITPLGAAEAASLATAYGSLSGRLAVLEAVENGSSALGRWTKWPDGRMVCTRKIAVSMTILTALNGTYFNNAVIPVADMPQTFADLTSASIIATCDTGGLNGNNFTGDVAGINTHTVNKWSGCYLRDPFQRPSVQAYTIWYRAEGFWK